MQAEGFVDDGVEVGERLEGAGVRVRRWWWQFGADFVNVRWIASEVVEEHGEGGGGGVGARDDDAKGVAVEPGAVGFDGVGGVGGGDEPGGDVSVIFALFGIEPGDAFAHLRVRPDEHGFPARGDPWDAESDAGQPGCRREEAEEGHAVAHHFDDEMMFARCEHVEGFAKGELAHEVEGEVMEPGCYV